MSLHQDFFKRETNIKAKVICDSINEQGVRITTLEVEYPRFIHSEFMTHRELSKNSSSSRAVPIDKMLDNTRNNMAVPLYWGKSKSGMQADGEVSKFDEVKCVLNWEKSFNYIEQRILDMKDLGLHKQIPNRLSEPFQMMKVVVTATNWDNFFNLRIHKDSQPEICMLAYKMYQAMQKSVPFELRDGEYHLPYISRYRIISGRGVGKLEYSSENTVLDLETAKKISVSCCAQTSYRNTDMSLEKADKIFDMLVKADVLHSSCFEHLATPVSKEVEIENSDYMTIGFINNVCDSNTWQKGVTHVNRRGELCSGNLKGWVSYRHLLPNNTCWEYDHEERMKMFK